jgi:ferric iron reductase protein FhuF
VLAGTVARFAASLGTDRVIAASLFVKQWAVIVARTAAAAYGAERRVPDVAASNSTVVFDDSGRPIALSLREPRFAALAADGVAGCPSAVVLRDEFELQAWFRARAIDGHLRLAVDAVAAIAPIAPQRLWANVAAACAGGLAGLSAQDEDPDRLRADAGALLDAADAPTRGLVRLVPADEGARARLRVERQVCCLYHRLPDAPAACLSCPLLSRAERDRRVTTR